MNKTINSEKAAPGSRAFEEQVFYYIYGVLHSPRYRQSRAHELKIDFPKIPFPTDYELFTRISHLGERMVDLHLMRSPELNETFSKFEIAGSNRVGRIVYVTGREIVSRQAFGQMGPGPEETRETCSLEEGRIYMNESQYFNRVKQGQWEYNLCGYQILHKWLHMRKGRCLRHDEIRHFIRVVRCIERTMAYREQIDEWFKQVDSKK